MLLPKGKRPRIAPRALRFQLSVFQTSGPGCSRASQSRCRVGSRACGETDKERSDSGRWVNHSLDHRVRLQVRGERRQSECSKKEKLLPSAATQHREHRPCDAPLCSGPTISGGPPWPLQGAERL